MFRPQEDDIRFRAYQRYLNRGQQPGQELDDWIEAERELRTGSASADNSTLRKGVVEGDRPGGRQQSSRRARKALDENGLSRDPVAVAQGAVGARPDQPQG